MLVQQTARTITSAGGSSSRTMSWDCYPDGKMRAQTDSGVPVGLNAVLVDNSDSQNTSATGTWDTSSAGSGFQGYDYRTHPSGTGTDTFTWKLDVEQGRHLRGLREVPGRRHSHERRGTPLPANASETR